MLAEGTLKANTPVNGVSAARQAASLPSSSKQATVTKPVVSEEEGKSAAVNRSVDTFTLSDAATVDSATLAASTQGPKPSNDDLNPSLSDESDQVEARALAEGQQAEAANTLEKEGAKAEAEEKKRLEEISEEAQAKLLNENISLRFKRDEETGEDLFQFVDKGSGDIVRQIPAEDALEFLKKFETVSGLLFSEQA